MFLRGCISIQLRCHFDEFTAAGNLDINCFVPHCLCQTTKLAKVNITPGDRGRVAQWLRCCVTNRKVAGSIPADVNGYFIDIKYFRSHYGPGVDSASKRNDYREYFLGVKVAGV